MGPTIDAAAEYAAIRGDLRQLAVTSAVCFALLFLLGFFLR
jgi:hypothetical protein